MPEQIIDASVAIKWVIKGEPLRHKARKLLRDSRLKGITLIAPRILQYEVENVLQRHLYRGRASIAAVDASLNTFYAVGIQIVTHPDMVSHARRLARQFHQDSIYDSLYAGLAELRGCEFWTADKAFYNAVQPSLPFVKYLFNYP